MKIIDIEEVENELEHYFDMDKTNIVPIMDIIKSCILDEEEIKAQTK